MTRVSRSEWLALAVILLVAALVRLIGIDSQALWADEALTGPIALHSPFELAVEPLDPTGPVYYWIYRLFVPEGASAGMARLPSVAAGLATIAFAFALGRRMSGNVAGLVAAALVALSAPLVDYSQEARAYALCVMFIAGSAWALTCLFEPARRRARRIRLAVFAVLALLAMFTHLVGFFWALPALALLILSARHGEEGNVTGREAMATVAAVLLVGLIEVRRMARYALEANAFTWLDQPGPGEFLAMLAEQWLPLASLGVWGGAVGLMLVAALLWLARRELREFMRAKPLAAATVAALLLEPLAVWLFGYVHSPIAMARTMLPGAIGFALIIGIAVAGLDGRRRIVAAAVAIAAVGVNLVVTGTVRDKEDWRGAVAAVPPDGLTIVCPDWKGASWIAASRNGPIALASSRMPLLLRDADDRRHWDRAYFDRFQGPLQRLRAGAEIGRSTRMTWLNEINFVASECSPDARQATVRWFGPGRVEILFESSGEGAIRVERWSGGVIRARPVRVLN